MCITSFHSLIKVESISKNQSCVKMFFLFLASIVLFSYSAVVATVIEPLECDPPDQPLFGGYGPKQDFYSAGDMIHYFCDTDTYIGGNFLRICEDSGDWSGDAPVCDTPARFSSVEQSSTADHPSDNNAQRATDGIRSTCALTKGGANVRWTGILAKQGELIRVMVYVPKQEVNYEVFLLKRDGGRLSCGKKTGRNHLLRWEFHNCPGPNNRDAVAVEIRSLNSEPLELCEVVAHTLTDPVCTDPHHKITGGYLKLTRKTADLVCGEGYTPGPDSRLECIRMGVWNRKNLYCLEKQWPN